MYLTQYKEICEKQGWTFETCDNGKKSSHHADYSSFGTFLYSKQRQLCRTD